jgi:energy-coupling factor transport system substrate-specific component
VHQLATEAAPTRRTPQPRVLLGVLVALAAAASFGVAIWLGIREGNAALALLLATAALFGLGVVWIELRLQTAKELALVATLGGLAAASRVLFHPLPDVLPMTALVIACGAALGPGPGAAIGAIGALVSNFVLGQGLWTPWQMLGWALCGAAGGLLRPLVRRRFGFAILGALLALAFGAVQNLQVMLVLLQQPGGQLGPAFVASYGQALSYDVTHAVTTAAVALAAGPALVRMLDRFARKLETEVVWE